jgi:hypothetical protein
MTPDIQILTQANAILSKCGRKQYDAGLTAVLIPRGFLVQAAFAVNGAATQTITKEITGDTSWLLRAISATSSNTTALALQVKLPNGKFLISNLQDVLQFAGYGSYRYLFAKDLECPPGSQLQLTLQSTNTGIAQAFAALFEGAYKYNLKGISPALGSSIGDGPRVLGSPNQNILAPCWQQGFGPATPAGCEDQEFIYRSANAAGVVVAPVALTSPNVTLQVQIDQDSDFLCRRLLVDVTADATVSTLGAFQVRPRTGNGYELSDDYFDIAQYIGSSQWAKDWTIAAGDQVFFDVTLTDAVGTGNMYLTVYLEGVRRKRK